MQLWWNGVDSIHLRHTTMAFLIWPWTVYYLLLPQRRLHNHSLRSHCHLSFGILWEKERSRKEETEGRERERGRFHSLFHLFRCFFVFQIISHPCSDCNVHWSKWALQLKQIMQHFAALSQQEQPILLHLSCGTLKWRSQSFSAHVKVKTGRSDRAV